MYKPTYSLLQSPQICFPETLLHVKRSFYLGLFTQSWAIRLWAPELIWELVGSWISSSLAPAPAPSLWLPWSRISSSGSGSAALAPWEPFHYINPLNFFVYISCFRQFQEINFFKDFLSLWDDKDRHTLFAFLQPMCGSRSQSWKWELKAKNSAPLELVPGAVY